MFGPCCEAEGVHVTLMYDSWLLLPFVRADVIIPGGDTVEMSVILQIYRQCICTDITFDDCVTSKMACINKNLHIFTPSGDLLLVSASNSNAGAIHKSGSHKCWRSHTRWDGNLLN